jgi:hypothetical protein
MICLNLLLSSCSLKILLLISIADSCIPYFQNDILFALMVKNYVLPNAMKLFLAVIHVSVLYIIDKQVIG